MRGVTVFVKDGHFSLTIDEAKKLLQDLQAGITHAELTVSGLHPPILTDASFITHSAMYEFFAQVYENNAALRNHAGKLFARIVAAASDNERIVVRCTMCDSRVLGYTNCPAVDKYHVSIKEKLMIDAKSLTDEVVEDFIVSGRRNVGLSVINDLRLLVNNL